MPNTKEFLKQLIQLPGLAGQEAPVRKIIAETWVPLVDEITTSKLGSLHGLKRGNKHLPEGEKRPSILLAAHMDAIGLMVSGFAGSLLRLAEIGGLDPRVLPGQLVTVHATADGYSEIPGTVTQPASFLLPPGSGDGVVPLEHLLVDTGWTEGVLRKKVRIGDLVSFAQIPLDMGEDYLAGHTLDDRASIAAITDCLVSLQGRLCAWDVWAVATVQEEEGLIGAITSAYDLRPDLAVAVDVTFASGPGSPEAETYPFGKGVTLGWGPNIHPGLFHGFKSVADQHEIPYALEPLPRHSGTDAYGMQVAMGGVPTMVVSIPLRYMHTPVEMVSIKDIKRAGRLLAEFIAQLTPDFMSRLSWDD